MVEKLGVSEKVRNYCIGLGALTALILGAWANLKGEPTAEKTWATTNASINNNRVNLNKLNSSMRKLHMMVVHMQGQQEGYNNAKLLLKIEKLESKSIKPLPDLKPLLNCRLGHEQIGGRCIRVTTAVSKTIKDAKASVKAAKAALSRERAQRAKSVAQSQKLPPLKLPSKLKPLPKNLDSASKSSF